MTESLGEGSPAVCPPATAETVKKLLRGEIDPRDPAVINSFELAKFFAAAENTERWLFSFPGTMPANKCRLIFFAPTTQNLTVKLSSTDGTAFWHGKPHQWSENGIVSFEVDPKYHYNIIYAINEVYKDKRTPWATTNAEYDQDSSFEARFAMPRRGQVAVYAVAIGEWRRLVSDREALQTSLKAFGIGLGIVGSAIAIVGAIAAGSTMSLALAGLKAVGKKLERAADDCDTPGGGLILTSSEAEGGDDASTIAGKISDELKEVDREYLATPGGDAARINALRLSDDELCDW